MYHMSAQGVDEHMINVCYYYYKLETVGKSYVDRSLRRIRNS